MIDLQKIWRGPTGKRILIEPLHIWWCPAAYWTPWFRYWGATGFRVVYADAEDCIHEAYCFVYRSFARDFQWGSRRVGWLKDAVVETASSPV